ncbi:MAG TPA: DUF2203 family protein [Longimicrobiaceae bacterium]|nr:DUF2203 family protein [Longimicrobiaceae bacterium]
MPRRAFRVDEAEALLPVMERVLAELERQRDEVRARGDKLEVLDLLWGTRLGEPGCPDRAEAAAHRAAVAAAQREMRRMVEVEVAGRGIRFPPGGLEHGLLDFPTTWEGRWVFLCWRRGEPRLRAWHEVDAGFAGRQRITPAQRAGMGAQLPLPDDPTPGP